MWVHVVDAVTFKTGQRAVVAWTQAIYSGQYQRHGLSSAGILKPYILIVIQATAQIDSQERNNIRPLLQCFYCKNSDTCVGFLKFWGWKEKLE